MKTITTAQVRTTSVRKWGNGHGVLLPKAFVDTLGLAHAEVQAVVRGSSIVLTKKTKTKTKTKKMTLKDLVRGMRKNDRQELIDFGAPQGREIW